MAVAILYRITAVRRWDLSLASEWIVTTSPGILSGFPDRNTGDLPVPVGLYVVRSSATEPSWFVLLSNNRNSDGQSDSIMGMASFTPYTYIHTYIHVSYMCLAYRYYIYTTVYIAHTEHTYIHIFMHFINTCIVYLLTYTHIHILKHILIILPTVYIYIHTWI